MTRRYPKVLIFIETSAKRSMRENTFIASCQSLNLMSFHTFRKKLNVISAYADTLKPPVRQSKLSRTTGTHHDSAEY